ncbi:hypothetical protein AK812_SmicGene19327 [Symbiodinium microadriaticum]|uniref:Uncharacterized protein n=1 Tax=Symbiodinium microadriaticum TaxID=2951 RepID=A0A1Q9DSU1_SYMMI|nr:hypothetical protein AK812_SmicGene19327 [Symbiodinium microadriaticum]CAE7214424.1 unnamed protein product [Symbiodinium microadriaticum]
MSLLSTMWDNGKVSPVVLAAFALLCGASEDELMDSLGEFNVSPRQDLLDDAGPDYVAPCNEQVSGAVPEVTEQDYVDELAVAPPLSTRLPATCAADNGDVLCLLTAVPVSTPSGCQHKKPESDRAWEFLFLFELTEKLLDPEKPPLREAGQPVSATPDCPVKARMSGRSALEWKFCGPLMNCTDAEPVRWLLALKMLATFSESIIAQRYESCGCHAQGHAKVFGDAGPNAHIHKQIRQRRQSTPWLLEGEPCASEPSADKEAPEKGNLRNREVSSA